MIYSKKSHEGYLLIDHSASPGTAGVGEGSRFEAATYTCFHCQKIVVIHPRRTRDRGYCGKCDHYVCDGCEDIRVKTGECVPFIKLVERN